MKDFINRIRKINLIIFVFLTLSFSSLNAQTYDVIKVTGNERLSVETILMFSGLKIGEDLKDTDINLSIKKLYETNYFKDIKIFTNKKTIEISIIENPIVQSIKLNGIKSKSILNQLTDVTKKVKNILT